MKYCNLPNTGDASNSNDQIYGMWIINRNINIFFILRPYKNVSTTKKANYGNLLYN